MNVLIYWNIYFGTDPFKRITAAKKNARKLNSTETDTVEADKNKELLLNSFY